MSKEVDRRAFLARVSQMAAALSVTAPAFSRLLDTAAHAEALERFTPDFDQIAPASLALSTGMHWRMLGPTRGGRTAAATGVPGRPNEFYFGAVNGGVWKTIDAGRVWEPVFDSQPVASIGAIAVAPSAPDTVYVGSGESTLRDSAGFGDEMYKSTDAGRTWRHIGLADTHHIGKIAVDPHDPRRLVAAIGHLYAANDQRGVFRSLDGGASWQKVRFKGPDVGAVEVMIDPSNPRVVYTGLWNTRRPPWFTYAPTNGPGGGIFKSTDGGTTWTQLTRRLPPGSPGSRSESHRPTWSRPARHFTGRFGIASLSDRPRRLWMARHPVARS